MNLQLNKYLIYYPTVFLRRQWVPFYLKNMRKTQWCASKEIEKMQIAKLFKLLDFAKSNIPYYQSMLKNVNPKQINSLKDFQMVPILTKDLLKENFHYLYQNLKGAIKKTTGGSTGNPVTVYKSPKALANAYAAYWRGYEWAGVGIGSRQGRFWGLPNEIKTRRLANITDFITNRYRCVAFSFDEEHLINYYNNLNRFKPAYFYGYVSMIEAFAKFLLKNNLKLKFNLKCVITTSELLTNMHRKLFEEVFQCKVYNEYGCGEIGTIAHECEYGSLHISAENMIVEILKEGKPAKFDELGDIVVTELNNTAMPLIRYNLKDIGAIQESRCKCGRRLPILKEIVGRAYDTIYNKEGKAFHGEYFMYIFEELQNIDIQVFAFQVIQINHEDFIIKVVKDEQDRDKLESYINNRVAMTYGSYIRIKYEYVSEIKRENSGKIRLIKSFINQ